MAFNHFDDQEVEELLEIVDELEMLESDDLDNLEELEDLETSEIPEDLDALTTDDIKKGKQFRFFLIGLGVAILIGLAIFIYVETKEIIDPEPQIIDDVHYAAMSNAENAKMLTASKSEPIALEIKSIGAEINEPEPELTLDYNYGSHEDVATYETMDAVEATTLDSFNQNTNAYTLADIKSLIGDTSDDNNTAKILGLSENFGVKSDCSVDKPVIYLYNCYDDIQIKLAFPGQLTCSYPELNMDNVWNLTAYDNSTFMDVNGVYYPYLFYEGVLPSDSFDSISEGACVKGSDTVSFLYETLTQFGLNDIECADFITYWAPKMVGNAYNVISFQNTKYSTLVPIRTDPFIDTHLRIYMVWESSDVDVNLTPQTLEVVTRPDDDTPYLVEWGGTQLNHIGTGEISTKQISQMSSDEMQQEMNAINQTVMKLSQRLSNLTAAATGIQAVHDDASSGGHTFTDKNGKTTVFTSAEWQKLHDTWDYTGDFNTIVNGFTVDDLKIYLKSIFSN